MKGMEKDGKMERINEQPMCCELLKQKRQSSIYHFGPNTRANIRAKFDCRNNKISDGPCINSQSSPSEMSGVRRSFGATKALRGVETVRSARPKSLAARQIRHRPVACPA